MAGLDPTADVMELLKQRAEWLTTADIVAELKNAQEEAAIVKALEYWREQGEVEQDMEGRWAWRAEVS